MKNYVIYFAANKSLNETKEFAFEYLVTANSEADAKEKAISDFSANNPKLSISDYTIGFSEC